MSQTEARPTWLERERQAIARIATDRVVDNRVYTDPDVYELELERIFERVWLFACHESEIAEPGDFLTTTLVGTSIIVCRDRDGRPRAYYNTCRHRGSQVVLDERGHCSAFRCPYHFWTYGLDGKLLGVSGEEAYEGTGFCKEDFPLVELACDSVHGLVFVTMADEPEALASWLGEELVGWLAKPLAAGPYRVLRRGSIPVRANWKVYAENTRDGYHVPFVHPFFRKSSPPGEYHLLENGHAVQELGMDPNGIEADLWSQLKLHPLPGVEVGEGYIANVWPDTAITLRSNVISIDTQQILSPTEVTMENRTLGLADDADDVVEARLLAQQTWFANPVELEDLPIFEAQQRGVSARRVRYSVIARGREARTGSRGDDNRLRAFWVKWRELMGVEGNSIES